jgi:hypothetical protein
MMLGYQTTPASMDNDQTTVEHIWLNIAKRQVTILDNEGYEERINWKFDEEGAEGFFETLTSIRNNVPEDTYVIV